MKRFWWLTSYPRDPRFFKVWPLRNPRPPHLTGFASFCTLPIRGAQLKTELVGEKLCTASLNWIPGIDLLTATSIISIPGIIIRTILISYTASKGDDKHRLQGGVLRCCKSWRSIVSNYQNLLLRSKSEVHVVGSTCSSRCSYTNEIYSRRKQLRLQNSCSPSSASFFLLLQNRQRQSMALHFNSCSRQQKSSTIIHTYYRKLSVEKTAKNNMFLT